jgi:serine/threonine protein kinase
LLPPRARPFAAQEVRACPLKRAPCEHKGNAALSYAYGTAVDVWSVGALAYQLLTGRAPYANGTNGRLGGTNGGTECGEALPYPPGVSAAAREFVEARLAARPEDRPCVQQLLRHRWLREARRSCEL